MISSQDYRNKYEKFYDAMRLYLWPYDVLEQLANVESNIYTVFINNDELSKWFSKLTSSIKEVLDNDEYLQKAHNELSCLINDVDTSYYPITRVSETNQEVNKVLKAYDKENELQGGISDENKKVGL